MKYRYLYSILWLLVPYLSIAQDPHFSQFYANKVNLNPAYAGFDPGFSSEISHRTQWFGLPDGDIGTFQDNYRTFMATAGVQLPCLWEIEGLNFGTSLSCFKDEAGNNPLSTSGFNFAFSNEFQLGTIAPWWKPKWKLERLDMRVGIQVGLMQKRLAGNYFIYSSQLDPVGGVLVPPGTLNLYSPWFTNISAGFMIRGYFKKNKDKGSLFTLGLSFNNLNEPNESLRDDAGTFSLPRRSTLHFGFTKKIIQYKGVIDPLYISPQFRWDNQTDGNLNLFTAGAYLLSKGYYTGMFFQGNTRYYKDSLTQNTLSGNFLTKNTSTLILVAGVDLKNTLDLGKPRRKRGSGIVLGVSYDIGLSGISQENTLGVVEINLQMLLNNPKNRSCNEIGKFELYTGKCPVRF